MAGRSNVATSPITECCRLANLTPIVNSKSALDRALTLLFRERSQKKNKIATLNEHITSALAAILSDISYGSDTNFTFNFNIYINIPTGTSLRGGASNVRGMKTSRFSTNISLYLQNDTRYGHSYYGRRIANRTKSFEWCHFL